MAKVQNWVTDDELAAMKRRGYVEEDRHVAEDDGRTVVVLACPPGEWAGYVTMRSLRDAPVCGQLELQLEGA